MAISEPEPHGLWQFSLEKDLMSLRLEGAFNAEGVVTMHREIAQQLANVTPIPSRALVDASKWDLSTLDSQHATRVLHQRMSDIGISRVAYVICELKIRELLFEDLWREHPEVERRYFSDHQQARRWLNEQPPSASAG